MLRPLVLLAPSYAALAELPRRLAELSGAQAGLYPMTLRELAQALAEPALLGQGLLAWDSGHDALLAGQLLDGPHGLRLDPELPRRPLAQALARTLSELRRAGLSPAALARLAEQAPDAEERERLQALAGLHRSFHETLEGRVADPAALLRAAREQVGRAAWLAGAELLVVEDLETNPLERELLAALARAFPVRRLAHARPPSLLDGSFEAWCQAHGVASVEWQATPLAPLAPPAPAASLRRLRERLFEPPAGPPAWDEAVELVSAPGEAAEARAVARRLLRAARAGVPFEEMGVVLPRPEAYAPLLADLLARLGIPFRLHPSLPLRFGRTARSLLLLFRCRGLERPAVMEFLTFAPLPFADFLGEDRPAVPARWDQISRDARVVSGLARWMIGLRAHAEAEQEAAEREPQPARREQRLQRAADAEALLRVVELLSGTLDTLAGEATWAEWSQRLLALLDQWLLPERDREAVRDVLADLASLGAAAPRATWDEVEGVLEARFEWERLPLEPVAGGAVHVGALDAMAGLPCRFLAVMGLVEGGYPGVVRPDPLLLDDERAALEPAPAPASGAPPRRRQLSLFDQAEAGGPAPPPLLPTSQDRVLAARRLFQRALGQARERLVLSYPRADPRTGRERLPSLFFVAAASALAGRPLTARELDEHVREDLVAQLPLEEALDRGERDRARLERSGREAAEAIAAGSPFFKQSRLAAEARWSSRFTPHDGLVQPLPEELRLRLDPLAFPHAISASRLASFSRCGFQYLLQHVLKLEPALEPEERQRLDPLERGNAFHEVAERFLRERRERGELPVRETTATRARLLELADQALEELVAGSPPRFALLWEREKARFRQTLQDWLRREAEAKGRTPAHFEVAFGLSGELPPGEPHLLEPVSIDLGDGRALRVAGRIDRIDRREDGTLALRDYKTGRAPRDDGGVFRGGRQLQIPFYLLAAERIFPGARVVEAFLDYVDAGRPVAFRPELVRSQAFRDLLRGLVDAIAGGLFAQEPSACAFCDYKVVCGPQPLIERRRQWKSGDSRLITLRRLREVV